MPENRILNGKSHGMTNTYNGYVALQMLRVENYISVATTRGKL